MKKSLVTVGAGFIRAHVTNELISMGHEVLLINDLSGGFEGNVNKNSIFAHGSITDNELVQKMAEWVNKESARSTPKFSNIEIIGKLPAIWQQ